MAPCLSINRRFGRRSGHIPLDCQGGIADPAGCMPLSPFEDDGFSQLGLRMPLPEGIGPRLRAPAVPLARSRALLAGAVSHVLPMRAEKQMVRTNAGGIV